MDDADLIRRLTARDPTALDALQKAYGGYCYTVAFNILGCRENAEETVNDAVFAAWNSIPPHKPDVLRAYLGKLTRNLALKRVRFDSAEKRGCGAGNIVYEELSECIAADDTTESAADADALKALLRDFVHRLPAAKQRVFVLRYWYFETVPTIAKETGMSEAKITSLLFRLRTQLKKELKEEGFSV